MPAQKAVPITADFFYKYLRCPHWVYWDVHGKQAEKVPLTEYSKQIWEHRVVDERGVAGSFGSLAEPDAASGAEARMRETLTRMQEGAEVIYRGFLKDGTWEGEPDMLVRTALPVGRRSRFGTWYYEPYDIKSDRIEGSVRDEFAFPLAFYSLILEKVQGIRPVHGYIVDAKKQTHQVVINETLEPFHLTLREIEKIIAGSKPAPFLASSCKESPWFAFCKRDAEASDDVSLIYKIRQSDHAKLHEAGIRSVADLASYDGDLLEQAVPQMSRRKLDALQRQARVLNTKMLEVIQSPLFPSSETEVYFDIEGDPLRAVEYLFGLLVVSGPRSRGKYTHFMAPTPETESEAWHAFLDFVKKLPEDAPIYHYGTYERAVVARMHAEYGGDAEVVEKLERNMVNLLTIVCETVALPVYFYSLKDIAKFIGFTWRDPQATGSLSIVWYEQYLQALQEKKKAKAAKALKSIIEYNEDDVRATLKLKRYLQSLPVPR